MKLGIAALSMAGIAIAPVAPASGQEILLRYNRWLPATSDIDNKVHKPWFDDVARVTGGRVKIEFTTSSLGPLPRQYELATSGVADVTFGSESLTPGRFPLAEILEIPFLGDSAEAISIAYWRVYKAHFEKTQPYTGTKLLALSSLPPYNVYNSKKPITSIADFGGLKLRAAGVQLTDTVRALGAVAVPAQITEVYDLLSKGVIDGALYTDDGVRTFNLAKFITYKTVIPGGISSYSLFFVMNARKWESIAEGDRKAIEAISGEKIARALGRNSDASAKLGDEQLRSAGTKIATADAEMIAALRQKLAFLEERWIKKVSAKSVDGAAALKMLREEAAAYKP